LHYETIFALERSVQYRYNVCMQENALMQTFGVPQAGALPEVRHVPRPVPAAGEVRIRVSACGVNFADLLMVQGKYQETPAPPFTLGMEVAGVVDMLGPDCAGPPCGTRVAAVPGQGGMAEYVCVPAARCVPLPETMPDVVAASFQIAYGTSHLALAHRAKLQPGETLLVLGAAGGVGLTAVEVGACLGATVIASARGADRLAIARAAGAQHLIDSDTPGLRDQLKALGGVDVVYDAVGGPAFMEALRATRPEGRLIPIGFAGGEVPQIPANLLLVKNLTVIGLYWGGYLKFNPKALTESMATLFAWHAEARLRPHVSHVLPLDRSDEALELLRSRSATGKVVVTLL
jgi:NADPH2:quinone reductase